MVSPLPFNFLNKIQHSGDCWLWTAYKDKNGYGRYGTGGRTYQAHRFAYELLVGKVPDGLVLDHLCFTPACVNPAHLEPTTIRENLLRYHLTQKA